MAKRDRIEIVIEGLPQNSGRVQLRTFMSQLQVIGAALNRLDKKCNGGKAGNAFQIASLSYNSPYRVALEAIPLQPQIDTAYLVIDQLKQVASAFVGDDNLEEIDVDLLEDIRDLARPSGKHVKHTTIIIDETSLVLGLDVYNRVESALAIEDECYGGVEGMLEQINLHHGANTFHVYPDVGPKKITCHFPAPLYDDAVASLGRRVRVFGEMKYRSGAPFAHQISVSSIDAFHPEDDLPDWDDLKGRAPDATGELSSEAFIRELRDDWG